MYYRNIPYWVKNKMVHVKSKELENNNQNEIGYLNINVFQYVLKTPIEGAIVKVSTLTVTGLYRENGLGVFINTDISDQDGKVPTFKLPVLKEENEYYIVSVQAPDYHTAYLIDVPIYPDVTTFYDIYLRHYSSGGDPDYEFIMQPQIIRQ
ncbi:hypothetical protein [Sedimentibacter sp.]|uniref:hypothetical protein n=1 Tax=Sedimentibacter sp. TaxID=1960295 RepID=UPI0028A2CD2E|nr:hypothetical protein [Sedimentibacter sp.]